MYIHQTENTKKGPSRSFINLGRSFNNKWLTLLFDLFNVHLLFNEECIQSSDVVTDTPCSANTSLATVKAPRTLGNPVYGMRCMIQPTISSGVNPTESPVLICIPICGFP